MALFWSIQAVFVVGEPLCDVLRNPFLRPNNFTQGHLMKIEWLVTDVTAVDPLTEWNVLFCG